MEFFKTFLSEFGTEIVLAILTFVAGIVGTAIKAAYEKYVNTKIKKDVAKTVVQAVEQIYKDLHGEEKLNAALANAADMLQAEGITVTDLELRMLIEAAVAEFNDAFNKGNVAEVTPAA